MDTPASTFSTLCAPFSGTSAERHDLALAVAVAKIDMRAAGKSSLFNFLLSAEPEQLRASAAGQSSGGRVVGVEDGEIILPLVIKDARFGVDVIRKRLVAIEMVGRDVQNHRDPGTKFNDRLQLKARYFKHGPGCRAGLIHKTDGGRADIAAHQCGEPSGGNNFAGQRGGGGLAVGSGNSDDWAGKKLRGEFDFADYRLSQVARLHQLRRIGRHTGAHDDEVLPTKRAVAVAAGFDRDAMLQQEQDFIAQFGFRLGIRHRDAGAARLQKKRGGHARLAETDDEHAFVVQLHQVHFTIGRHCESSKQNKDLGFQITITRLHSASRGEFLLSSVSALSAQTARTPAMRSRSAQSPSTPTSPSTRSDGGWAPS